MTVCYMAYYFYCQRINQNIPWKTNQAISLKSWIVWLAWNNEQKKLGWAKVKSQNLSEDIRQKIEAGKLRKAAKKSSRRNVKPCRKIMHKEHKLQNQILLLKISFLVNQNAEMITKAENCNEFKNIWLSESWNMPYNYYCTK